MGKTKETRRNLEESKQLTLDGLSNVSQKGSNNVKTPVRKKQIIITEIGAVTKETELALKLGFRLVPSKTSFSKVKSDLWFDGQQISSVSLGIPQSRLATDDFEVTPVLDMNGISAGPHTVKVEMYESWSQGEKLSCTSKEVTVEYTPQSRQSRLIKVPTVKSIAGADLEVVSESEKRIYHQIEESKKKELISKRDEW